MLRHRAKKASLDVGYVSEWNDDHILDFDDELVSSWTFGSTNFDDSLSKVEDNGGSVEIEMVDNHNFCHIESSATANGLAVLKVGDDDVTNKLDLPEFICAIKAETTGKLEFGFFRTISTPFTANQAGAYFRFDAGKLYAVTGDGVDETVTEISGFSTYDQYKIVFTSTDVRFYAGDIRVLDASHATNIPTDDLTLKLAAKEIDSVSQIMFIDAFALSRLRKK